jgi:hypothetical protein
MNWLFISTNWKMMNMNTSFKTKTDTTHTCCGQCQTRYCVTSKTVGFVLLRYTPESLPYCKECSQTKDKFYDQTRTS